MGWLNYYGLIAVTIVMVSNIVIAAVNKGSFENKYHNKSMLALKQIGR